MNVYHFNTGRLYAEHGQRISYTFEDGGKTVHFHDHSRMIAGTIRRTMMTLLFTPKTLMARYDRGEYETTREADAMSFYRDGALTEFDEAFDTFLNI